MDIPTDMITGIAAAVVSIVGAAIATDTKVVLLHPHERMSFVKGGVFPDKYI